LSKPIDLERFRIELLRLLPAFPSLAETEMQLAFVHRMVAQSRRQKSLRAATIPACCCGSAA